MIAVSMLSLGAPVTHPGAKQNKFAANEWYVKNGASVNPFALHDAYINPANVAEIETSIATSTGTTLAALQAAAQMPSAYWIDNKAKIRGNGTASLEGILADAASKPTPPLVVFILYDLPNRDCNAKASNGEICCYRDATTGRCDYTAQGDCAEGLQEYEDEYVTPFAQVLGAYHERVPIAVIVEPDSLPNLATNAQSTSTPCGNPATGTAYKSGIEFAVKTVAAQAPSVALYLDAAHGGWLGWMTGVEAYLAIVQEIGIAPYLRGFSSNVANYQALGEPCPASAFGPRRTAGLPEYCRDNSAEVCCTDPCGLLSQYNSGNNEMNYAQVMGYYAEYLISGFTPHWLIDTGRNGQDDMRQDCSNWCNM